MSKLIPFNDYLVCEEVREESGVVTGSELSDHWQKFKVLAAGPGRWDSGTFIANTVKPGDIVQVQKHAEADTPDELRQKGIYLIMASRVMAKEA